MLSQPINTIPQPVFAEGSVPVIYMFAGSDDQQSTSSARMMKETPQGQLLSIDKK